MVLQLCGIVGQLSETYAFQYLTGSVVTMLGYSSVSHSRFLSPSTLLKEFHADTDGADHLRGIDPVAHLP